MTANPSIDPARFLSEHLERAEPDLLRSMLKAFVEALMGAEADALCGAAYGARTEDRVNSRNGYRPRDPNIDPDTPVPDDPEELLPDAPEPLPPAPVEPTPEDPGGDSGGVPEPA